MVVITGGTGVLGRGIGEYLALQGAKVVLMGRNEETGKQIADDIRGKGGEVMFLRTDVMNPVVVEQNLQDVLSAYGKVDALLNAAGGNMPGATIAPTGTFFDLKVEEFERVLNVNLTERSSPRRYSSARWWRRERARLSISVPWRLSAP